MPIIRWKPFRTIDEFLQELEPSFSGWDLAVDVYEDENNVMVDMQTPGVDPDKVEIEVEDTYLKVSGSREEEEETEDRHYYKREIRRGSFERVVSLPCPVAGSQARAEFEGGLLKIVLPKEKGKAPSRIKVVRK